MQAETIELLSVKGKFSTEQAVILAAAIDMAIERSQLVTVPILDVRFAAVDGRFDAVDGRFDAIDARFAAVGARFDAVDARFTAIDARFTQLEARLDLKMQRWAVKIVIATLVGQTALGPLGVQAFSSLRQALSTLVR